MTRPTGYNSDETHTDDGLPRERLRAARPRTLVIEWSVALAVVVLINLVAIGVLDRFDPNRFRVQIEVKYDRLREAGANYDSLILGDSTPNQGIMPIVLNPSVGGTWMNLATVADMQAVSDAWMLGEFIERYGPPKRVIVSHVPDMWGRELDPAVLAQVPVPIADFAQLNPPADFSWPERIEQATTRYLPIYGKNASLLSMVKMPWKIEDFRGAFDDAGFMPMPGKVPEFKQGVQDAIDEHAAETYSLSEHNAGAVQRLIELAEKHDFTIYLMPGSVSEALAGSPGYRRNFDAMIGQYRKWAASSDHLTLLFDQPQVFADELMYDEDHVNLDGASIWTQRIADAIIAAEDEGRAQ